MTRFRILKDLKNHCIDDICEKSLYKVLPMQAWFHLNLSSFIFCLHSYRKRLLSDTFAHYDCCRSPLWPLHIMIAANHYDHCPLWLPLRRYDYLVYDFLYGLCVCCMWWLASSGVGVQFLTICTGVLLMAMLGLFNVHRHGSLNTAAVVLYALTSCK